MSKDSDWKRDELFIMFSKRTNRKNAENYIVNAVWQQINNMDLQPVTQQCIHLEDGSWVLIDLYFPQIKYGIECDEEYHQDNTLGDLRRTQEIEHVLSSVDVDNKFYLKRIDATQTLEVINNEIAKAVRQIKKRVKTNKPLIWKSVEERINDIIAKESLEDRDLIPFPTHASTASCFGKSVKPKGWQQSYFSLNDEYQVWFPNLTIEKEGNQKAKSTGWVNILSEDWDTIVESRENKEEKAKDKKLKKKRITFARSKDVYGKDAYRFIGVFRFEHKTHDNEYVYKRESSKIDLTQFLNRNM